MSFFSALCEKDEKNPTLVIIIFRKTVSWENQPRNEAKTEKQTQVFDKKKLRQESKKQNKLTNCN